MIAPKIMATDQAPSDGGKVSGGDPARARGRGGATDWADLAQALDRVEFGMAVFDGGVVRLANHAAANLVGASLEQIVGHHIGEFVTPTDDLFRDIEELETGRFQGFRARRSVNTPGGGRTLFWVTMRTVEIGGQRLEIAIFAPEKELGQLGRHPTRAWMDLIPVCLGVADRHWRIRSISAEVYELLGRLPSECIGTQLLDWVDPVQREELSRATANAVDPGIFPEVSMSAAGGASATVCVMLAPLGPEEHDNITFALVGRLEDYLPPSGDRVNELELRLRRIAAEVRAAGVMDSLSRLPRGDGAGVDGPHQQAMGDPRPDGPGSAGVDHRRRALHQPQHRSEPPCRHLQEVRRPQPGRVGREAAGHPTAGADRRIDRESLRERVGTRIRGAGSSLAPGSAGRGLAPGGLIVEIWRATEQHGAGGGDGGGDW